MTGVLNDYVNEKKQVIEMTSVGADGQLWTMTGSPHKACRRQK